MPPDTQADLTEPMVREIIDAFEAPQEGHELAQKLERVWPVIKRALLASVSQPQADLAERARNLVQEFRVYLCNLMIDLDEPEIEWMTEKLVTALQSERDAALMDGGEWRTKLAEQIGKTQAAAAEARRAAIKECAQWHRNLYRGPRGAEYGLASEAERKAWRDDNQWHLSCADAIEELASPPEETR